MKPSLFFFILSILIISSCKKNSNKPVTQAPVDVYIVGADSTNAVVWKNGIKTILNTSYAGGELHFASASWILFSGNDTYITGQGENKYNVGTAVYWKNGVMDTLQSVTEFVQGGVPVMTSASAIAVSGNDIYIGGSQFSTYTGLTNGAILWKNGVPTAFGGLYSNITSLYVMNGNIYYSGDNEGGVGTNLSAAYYKNGSEVKLTDYNTSGSCYDVQVSNGNIYNCGYVLGKANGNAAYWKNGILQYTSPNESEAFSLNVSGNDIYMGGTESVNNIHYPTIWKNGEAMHLDMLGYANGICDQVLVNGSDVYAIGYIRNITNNLIAAVLWKNGVATKLSSNSQTSYAFTMALKSVK